MQMGVLERQLHFIAAVAFSQATFSQEFRTLAHGAKHCPAQTGDKGELRKAPAVDCSLAELSCFRLGWALCDVTCVLRDILFLHRLEEQMASARLRLDRLG